MIVVQTPNPVFYENVIFPLLKSNFKGTTIDKRELGTTNLDNVSILVLDLTEFSFELDPLDLDYLSDSRTSVVVALSKTKVRHLRPKIENIRCNISLLFHPWTPDELVINLAEAHKSYHLREENQNLWEEQLLNSRFNQMGDLSSLILHDLMGRVTRFQTTLSSSFDDTKAMHLALSDQAQLILDSLVEFRDLNVASKLEREPQLVSQLIHPFLPMWEKTTDRKGIRWNLEITDDFDASIRSIELAHIIQILINNSYRALEGEDDGEIKLLVQEPDIIFTDNGKKLGSTEKKSEGMGIGLYLSKRLMSQVGGELITNKLQRGFQVVLRWPN